ncbi:MAG: AraC family transcriptional regulator [Bradyrhizobium sp.]|jgi:AraC-like DNA-binding protein|uniref:AraC family transcriptional regulator n=1 Tax=Bradyrhizobium sp. TaxID=376 RepID=UPI00120C1C03|nr:AraC family transcriptional regulator [Bradyrhizobium sp.]THD57360.1 MAG: AraC family transcriptional regulator [Bradyrhizobium sp.]
MPVFQRLFFETQPSEQPIDPAIRANIWADRFRELITSMDVDFLAGDATLFGRHNLLSDGTIVVGEMVSSSFRGIRAKQHIQPNDDSHVYLSFNIGNTTQASRQFGREAEARPGEALLAVLEAGIEALAPANGHCVSLKIPAAHFVQWGLSPADLACRKLDCSGADYRLLTGYARMLIEMGEQLGPAQAAAASRHLVDLTGYWLGAGDKVREQNGDAASAHGRLFLIRQFIVENARDPRLGLQSVSSRLGMPARTVQHLLATAGESFSQLLMGARLHRAYTLLLDPAFDDLPVGTIASNCGFADVTSFHRVFRAAFDSTPGNLRKSRPTR